jgi:hypothetical protein
MMYIFFASDASECALNVTLITINILLCIFILAISVHPKIQEANPSSSLLQPALVASYCSYLLWSALMRFVFHFSFLTFYFFFCFFFSTFFGLFMLLFLLWNIVVILQHVIHSLQTTSEVLLQMCL